MFTFDEVKQIICKKFAKPYSALSPKGKALIADAYWDVCYGRYSKFLMWDLVRIIEFFEYAQDKGVNYFELSDPERWALEDSFDM